MKKMFFMLVIMLQAFLSYGNVLNDEIKLPKNYKIKGSFSGELTNEGSFHIITAQDKNKRDFELFVYTYFEGQLKELNKTSFDKQPSILSFHSTNDLLTLVVSFKLNRKDYYNVLDFNLESGAFSISKDFLNGDNVATFRNKNNTVLLKATKKKLLATKIINSEEIKSIPAIGYDKEIYNEYFNSSLVELNQNEFVKNGSVALIKGYFQKDILLFTKDFKDYSGDGKKHFTSLLTFDLANPILKKATFSNKSLKKITENNSYILDNILSQITSNKENGLLTFFDINTGKLLSSYNLFDLGSSAMYKGNDFISMEHFFKETSKKRSISTITLNETKNGNYLVRVDYVDATYNYHFNWWWWHHHMFMMHQQQMMIQNSIPKGFGPNIDEYFFNYYFEATDHSFQLVIDRKGLIVDRPVFKTVFIDIDKKKYVDDLNNDKSLKYSSSCFVNNKFRYLGYSKKSKSFKLFNRIIND